MVLDTSALLVILLDEPESPSFRQSIEADPIRLLSAASLLETALVVEARFGEAGGRELDLLLHKAQIQVVGFDVDQAELAREGWRQFGRGRHPANLNFGDCFAYALSKISGERLLYKGGDFSLTDVSSVVPS